MTFREEPLGEDPGKVHPDDACPRCGERNPDCLEITEGPGGAEVTCLSCGFTYEIPE